MSFAPNGAAVRMRQIAVRREVMQLSRTEDVYAIPDRSGSEQ